MCPVSTVACSRVMRWFLVIFVAMVMSHATTHDSVVECRRATSKSCIRKVEEVEWIHNNCIPSSDGKTCNWADQLHGPNDATDQGACGACWTFSLAALIEAKYYQMTLDTIKLSEGFFVDCLGGDGCAGGHPVDGFKFLKEHQYAPGYSSYRWRGFYSGSCHDKDMAPAHNVLENAWIADYRKLAMRESALEEALKTGPVVVNMYVSVDLFGYKTGLFEDTRCLREPKAHSWLAVGYSDDAWLFKNSYGLKWGDSGLVSLARTNTAVACRMLTNMYTVELVPKRDIEYMILNGGVSDHKTASAGCKTDGYTLAVIPTKMHWNEVLAKFQAKYGAARKSNEDFNVFWIGISNATVDDAMWDDGETKVTFDEYERNEPKQDYVVMDKEHGGWTGANRNKKYRAMCSKYTSEMPEFITVVKKSKNKNSAVRGQT